MTEEEFAKLNTKLQPHITKYKGKNYYTHRILYIRQYGAIPEGHVVTKEGLLIARTALVKRKPKTNISIDSITGQYRVQGWRAGKYHWVGRYNTLEAAESALKAFNLGHQTT